MSLAHHDSPRVARSARAGAAAAVLLALIVVAALAVIAWQLTIRREVVIGSGSPRTSGGDVLPRDSMPGGPTDFPVLARKPRPEPVAFGSCPAEGDGGDRALNRLKNRGDSAAWRPVHASAILALDWPSGVGGLRRDGWTRRELAAVGRYEGTPVAVEGYLNGARESGMESTNCHERGHAQRDWHVWLSESPGRDRTRSIVVEPTPFTRARHPEWTLARLNALVAAKRRVRVSGWLMLDPEHPDQLQRTRGTLWEVHPVFAIEVQEADGRWVPLGRETRARTARTPRRRPRAR